MNKGNKEDKGSKYMDYITVIDLIISALIIYWSMFIFLIIPIILTIFPFEMQLGTYLFSLLFTGVAFIFIYFKAISEKLKELIKEDE
jgi:uncharacterized membrane protein